MTTAITVRRYRCDWCGKTRSRKTASVGHEAVCHHNPASRACTTCVHFERTPCCAEASDGCGCMGRNDCAVGAFVTWRFDDHDTHEPVADGWWTHVEDWRRDCPSWAPVPPRSNR